MLKLIFISLMFSCFSLANANETLYKISYKDKIEDADKVEVFNNLMDFNERVEAINYTPESFTNLKITKPVNNGKGGFVALIKRGGEGGGE